MTPRCEKAVALTGYLAAAVWEGLGIRLRLRLETRLRTQEGLGTQLSNSGASR